MILSLRHCRKGWWRIWWLARNIQMNSRLPPYGRLNIFGILLTQCILKKVQAVRLQLSQFQNISSVLKNHEISPVTDRAMILVTSGYWWQFLSSDDRISILATSFECWYPKLMLKDRRFHHIFRHIGDENGQNRHQHLKFVANIFRLQHPSSTSLLPTKGFENRSLFSPNILGHQAQDDYVAEVTNILKMSPTLICQQDRYNKLRVNKPVSKLTLYGTFLYSLVNF